MRTDGFRGATGPASVAGLTATGAETVFDTANDIDFAINGKGDTKAAVTDGTTPTTDLNSGETFEVIGASEGAVFVWCLEDDGTVVVAQSEVVELNAEDEFEHGPPGFPETDLNEVCPFAYMVVKNGSGGSNFAFGSDNWNQSGLSVSIQDVLFGLPDRPQSS